MRLRTTGLAILLVFMLLTGMTSAQTNTSPLLITISGDIWAWDGTNAEPRQLTTGGYNSFLSVSPDGTRVAYTKLPQMVVEALQREGGMGGGALPSNVWVMDIASGESTLLVDQPEGASFFTEGIPDLGVARSKPMWSADGSKIAWTEMEYPSNNQSLVVYDFATSSAQTIVTDLPVDAAVPTPKLMKWGQEGLYVWNFAMKENSTQNDISVNLYDETGTLLNSIPLVGSEQRFTVNHILVSYNGKEYIGVQYNTGEWEIVDPLTGTSQPAPNTPQLSSTAAPESSVNVEPTPAGDGTYTWQIVDANGAPMQLLKVVSYVAEEDMAVSPDGAQVAFVDMNQGGQTQVNVWQTGGIVAVPSPAIDNFYISELAWGPQAWHIITGANPVPTPGVIDASAQNVVDCPGALPPRLLVGGQGRVLPGGANNLRTSPSTSGDVSGQIPVGETFVVTTGPQCADGVVWWAVDYGGMSGWTAESQGSTYFLEPLG
jgi:hypothetical protein